MFDKQNLIYLEQNDSGKESKVIYDSDTGIAYALSVSWPSGMTKEEAIAQRTLSDSVLVTHPTADQMTCAPLYFTGPYATSLWTFLKSRAIELSAKHSDGSEIKQFCEALYDQNV